MTATACADLWQDLLADAQKPPLSVTVAPLREDPTLIFRPLGIECDAWQRDVLTSNAEKILLLCSRQSGKSQCAAGLALVEALTHDYAEVLILSRTLRQALELMRKVKELWRGIVGGKVNRRRFAFNPNTLKPESDKLQGIINVKGWDGAALLGDDWSGKVKDRALTWEGPNGSRITALPGTPDSIVSFSSVTMLILDEASRIPDGLYTAVRPMLAVTEQTHGRPGRMVVASTPFGKRGWFYEAWQNCEKYKQAYDAGTAAMAQAMVFGSSRSEECSEVAGRRYSGDDGWLRTPYQQGWEGKDPTPPFQTFRVTADQCPRITQQFLEDERAQLGTRWASQEYDCQFVDTIDNVFSSELISGMFTAEGSGPLTLWIDN